jgi:hypothetical protein
VFVAGLGCCLAEALQEIGEDRMRMERDVSEDVMEDVRLRDVVERVRGSDRDGGGEAATREGREEQLRLEKPLHWHGAPASLWFEARVHLVEVRDAVALQADDFDPLKERARCMLFEVLHAAVVERLPNAVVVSRVARPILADVEGLKAELDLFTMTVLVTLHYWLQK